MAYGVGTPADDWTQVYSNHSENKNQNSSLVNPLTAHGTYCRRWNSNSATAQARTLYTLKDASFANTGSKSIRGFFRLQDISHSTLYSTADLVSPNVTIYDTGDPSYYGYTVGYGDANDGNSGHCGLVFGYGYRDDVDEGIRHKVCRMDTNLYDLATAQEKWMGMRLDVIKEDQDAHIYIYVVDGPANCNDLDASGEPDWGSPVMEIMHYNGSDVASVITGTKLGNFNLTTPILDGQGAFGFCQKYQNNYMQTFVDSISYKKM